MFSLLLSVSRVQEWARAFGILGLAAGVEIGQGVIGHYRPEWSDFRIDGVGVAIALALFRAGQIRGLVRRIGAS